MIFFWGKKKKKAAEEAAAQEARANVIETEDASDVADDDGGALRASEDVAEERDEIVAEGEDATPSGTGHEPEADAPPPVASFAPEIDPPPADLAERDDDLTPVSPAPAPPPQDGVEPTVAEPEPVVSAEEQPVLDPEQPDGDDDGVQVGSETTKRSSFFGRLAQGLRKSSSKLSDSVSSVFTKRKLDDEALEDLEDLLLAADLGAGPTSRVIQTLAKDKFDKDITDADVKGAMAQVVSETLTPHERAWDLSGPSPQVVMFVGVNGSGKTTTVGKIAAMMAREGRKVVLAAGDTFRAAAVEQLKVWGERTGSTVIAREHGADAAGLVFDAYAAAKAEGADALLVDTAGRLQNKAQLMDELKKVTRVIKKQDETAPHHVFLVLDATVGQNAISQTDAFKQTSGVTGLVMTKLDGTAKGGVLVALADKHPDLPIYFTGIGEGIDDLRPFSAGDFARALAGLDDTVDA